MNKDQLKTALVDAPFKTVFKATIAFYVAQALMAVAGLAMFVGGIYTLYLIFG